MELEELDDQGALEVDDLLSHYAAELRASDQGAEADRVTELAARAADNFLMVVPHKVQADPSSSTE